MDVTMTPPTADTFRAAFGGPLDVAVAERDATALERSPAPQRPLTTPLDRIHAQIGYLARQYLDTQKIRIAMLLRAKQLERTYGDDAALLDLAGAQFSSFVDPVAEAEKRIARQMERLVRQHFMGDWIAQTRGIGPLGFALLIGITGPLDLFPTVSKLWKFLGQDVRPDGMAPRRQKGVAFLKTTPERPGTAYSPQGRVLCHQLGDAIVKLTESAPGAAKKRVVSPYRLLYDRKKAEYLARERTGPSACPFGQTHASKPRNRSEQPKIIACGDAHVHNAAMRYAVKCLLRDLWVAWQQARGQEAQHTNSDHERQVA